MGASSGTPGSVQFDKADQGRFVELNSLLGGDFL